MEWMEGFLFGRVVRRRFPNYAPYYLVDNSAAAVLVKPASTSSEYTGLTDPRNKANDLLYLPKSLSGGYPWIMHGAIGVDPPPIYTYIRFPAGKDVYGSYPNSPQINPIAGDTVGFIDTERSPYRQPTDFAELVIPPGIQMSHTHYNQDDVRPIRPKLNPLFAIYWFQLLQPGRHDTLIGKIARKEGVGANALFLTVGGWGPVASPISLGDTLIQDWKPNPLKLDEAMGLTA